MIIDFWVPGVPAPGGSKSAFPLHTGKYKTNKKGQAQEIIRVIVSDAGGKRTKDWRTSVREACRSVFASVPLMCPVKMSVVFYMPYRKGDFGTGKKKGVLKANAPKFVVTKPDCLKLIRSTEDSLTNLLWVDDSQVVQIQAVKMYSLRPGAQIRVETMEDRPATNLEVQNTPPRLALP